MDIKSFHFFLSSKQEGAYRYHTCRLVGRPFSVYAHIHNIEPVTIEKDYEENKSKKKKICAFVVKTNKQNPFKTILRFSILFFFRGVDAKGRKGQVILKRNFRISKT